MDERVRRYSMHLELDFKLPVISAVLFLKGGPPGVELRRVEQEVAGRVFSIFYYFAFGLSRSLAEEYVDLPQALAPALAALMRSKIWDKPEQKLRCRKAIRRAGLPLAEAFVLDKIVDTQLKLDPTQEKRYRELERREGKEIQEMVITWEDALADRYDKGRTEGELQATRRAIVLLARHRHEELPDGFEERLEAIGSLKRLHEILERISDSRSWTWSCSSERVGGEDRESRDEAPVVDAFADTLAAAGHESLGSWEEWPGRTVVCLPGSPGRPELAEPDRPRAPCPVILLHKIVDTQLKLDPTQEKRYRELERREGKEIQEMVITWEDALADRYDKGRTKGRTEGEAKGRAEGELQATRRAIVLLARHRHGELPDGFEERLEAIGSLKRLHEILERISDVASLEEPDLVP